MSVPNLLPIVQAVHAQGWDFTTKAGLCAYSNAVVLALHAEDPLFGHLVKSEGQNHCTDAQGRLHAVDVTFYYPTGQVVDFISSAGFGTPPPPNTPTWSEGPVGEYSPESWYAPGPAVPPDPEPPDEDLAERVTALEEEVRALWLRINALADTVEAHRVRMEAINDNAVHPPLPDYIGSGRAPLFGGTVSVLSKPKPPEP